METVLRTQKAPEDTLDAEGKPRLLDNANYLNHKQNNKQVLCTAMGIPHATRSQEDVEVHWEPKFGQDTVKFNKDLRPKDSEAEQQTSGVRLMYKLISGCQLVPIFDRNQGEMPKMPKKLDPKIHSDICKGKWVKFKTRAGFCLSNWRSLASDSVCMHVRLCIFVCVWVCMNACVCVRVCDVG